MKNAVVWDVARCKYFVNRRFGGKYRPSPQTIPLSSLLISHVAPVFVWHLVYSHLTLIHCSRISYTLKMEAILRNVG
jgi:hypothetical protein